MIYAIAALGTEFVKFGYASRDPSDRLESMQTGCPFELRLIAYCQGDRNTEAAIHARLIKAKAFVRGEWFMMCEETAQVLKEMKAKDVKAEPAHSAEIRIANRTLRIPASIIERKPKQWVSGASKRQDRRKGEFPTRARPSWEWSMDEWDAWFKSRSMLRAQQCDKKAAHNDLVTQAADVDKSTSAIPSIT